ncbi:gluconate 2-dehydrogenase subunit 3 family protein [Pedobacter petrophilus]|uniref:Gluconate 2-dehydrogenase subunit 3 family protein n=1 Tax=Pedobacter petrophilus TaxID=1908241 RepID=A0A7K0G653_9SPHI|nr:gluconate 2-dehydrogenase subunit 3 family protein [Pedobacter petrophilus]MRX78689.1 gluconate 2-dehydrogenase subunit 3 family protein [Pedobacter petrophilus]
MDRRELLKSIAILTGGTLIGADALLSSFTNPDHKAIGILSLSQVNLLNEIGETILPTTAKSKGAKAANVGALMNVIITDCYQKEEQTRILESLKQVNIEAFETIKKTFLSAGKSERHQFLTALDQKAYHFQKEKQIKDNEARKSDDKFVASPNHYFTGLKQLILWAYFNSEIGATEALRFVSVPTRYEGCVPYHKGDRAWY